VSPEAFSILAGATWAMLMFTAAVVIYWKELNLMREYEKEASKAGCIIIAVATCVILIIGMAVGWLVMEIAKAVVGK
jgi:hypothetical protein